MMERACEQLRGGFIVMRCQDDDGAYRIVPPLHHVEDTSVLEIAGAQGISGGAVQSRTRNGQVQLK